MFLYEFLTTLFWFTLGLALLSTVILYLQPSAPTLRIHRFWLKSKISPLVFWMWLMLAMLFYSLCQDFFVGALIPLIAVLLPVGGNIRAEYLKKRLLAEEIQYVQGTLDTPRVPIEETNLSVVSVATTLVFTFAGLLLITAGIAYQLFSYLYHPEEYLIGGSMIAMMVLLHFIFAFLCFRWLFKDDFPEITEENRDEIYLALVEYRDEKQIDGKQVKAALWVIPLVFITIAVPMLSIFALMYTPFGQEVMHRIDDARWSRPYFDIDSRTITIAEPESQMKIVATASRANTWTRAFTPLGFASDDEGRLLYSELIREAILLQTQDEPSKPFVEPMILAPDFLMIPFYFRRERQDVAAQYLENVVFGNQLEESTFDAAKTALLEKLRAEKSHADACATKFALAARRQVVDFGRRHVELLGDLENANWQEFQEYYRNRFSRYQMPLVFQTGERMPDATLDDLERQLEILAIDVRRKPRPPGALPGEYRATWDIEFPAIVATWTLPDPKELPDKHGNMLLAVKAMERQLRLAPKAETNIAAVHSGSFAAPEGLVVFVSVVWERETPIEHALSVFESNTSEITATSSLPDWLKTERLEIALHLAPRWQPRIHVPLGSPSALHQWSTNRYRYALLFENEEQYRTLARNISHAIFYSVQRAFDRGLTRDRRTLVILMPHRGE